MPNMPINQFENHRKTGGKKVTNHHCRLTTMSTRRRLRVVCSSDEEDDDDIQQLQPPPQHHHHFNFPTETLNLQNVTLTSSNPLQIDISDEEFIDATENLSNSPPPLHTAPSPEQHSATSSVGINQASDSPVSRVLEDLGLRLKAEWLDSCLAGLQTAVAGFSSFDDTKKAKLCFERFLNSDMNYCGAGLLPSNVHRMHLVDLPGPFVLQVLFPSYLMFLLCNFPETDMLRYACGMVDLSSQEILYIIMTHNHIYSNLAHKS